MNRILLTIAVVAGLALTLSLPQARAELDPPLANQSVEKSTGTFQAFYLLGGIVTQVDTPTVQNSFVVTVENLDSVSAVCCAYDSGFSTAISANTGRSCQLIPKATSGVNPFATFYRWAQALKLWCSSLEAQGGASEVRVHQGR